MIVAMMTAVMIIAIMKVVMSIVAMNIVMMASVRVVTEIVIATMILTELVRVIILIIISIMTRPTKAICPEKKLNLGINFSGRMLEQLSCCMDSSDCVKASMQTLRLIAVNLCTIS